MAAEQRLLHWVEVEALVSRVAVMPGEYEGGCLHVDMKTPVAELKR